MTTEIEWTRAHPTEPGWYWFRRDGSTTVEVVYSRVDMFLRAGDTYNHDPLKYPGDWSLQKLPSPK